MSREIFFLVRHPPVEVAQFAISECIYSGFILINQHPERIRIAVEALVDNVTIFRSHFVSPLVKVLIIEDTANGEIVIAWRKKSQESRSVLPENGTKKG